MNLAGQLQGAVLLGVHHLDHDDVLVGHGTVVDQVVLAAKRVAFVGQDAGFSAMGASSKSCNCL